MVIRAPAERPAEFAVCLGDGVFIDAGVAMGHQALLVEGPVLVAIGPEPVSAIIVVFIGIPDRDPVAFMDP